MAAPMVKTKTPGIYKRGGRYVVTYKVDGRSRKESARTYEDARRLKAARTADRDRGELHEESRIRFREYAAEWVERYQGRAGSFRESTREEYRRCLDQYAYPYFDERLRRRVSQVTPRDVASFVRWLCDEREQGKALTDSTVRNIDNPVRACLRSAVQEGVIRHNPAQAVTLPRRPIVEEDAEDVRAFTRQQLATILRLVNKKHRLLFELLSATGLRISEAIAVEWRHLQLDGSSPHVKVRQAIVRGRLHPAKVASWAPQRAARRCDGVKAAKASDGARGVAG